MARIGAHEEWIEARKAFLVKEKEFSRLRDQLNAERPDLPRERVTENYSFDGAAGERNLEQLFGSCSQLIVYHFMFPPGADNFNGIAVHLRARDVSFVTVSRTPYAKLAAYKQRMGWEFDWVSSSNNTFNYDYFASFTPEQLADGTAFYNYAESHGFRAEGTEVAGVSVFYKSESEVFHTYSAFARGIDMVNGAYHYLDLVPKGRDEQGHDNPQFWVHRHDEY